LLDPALTGWSELPYFEVEGQLELVCFPDGIPEGSAGWNSLLVLGGATGWQFRRRWHRPASQET